MKQENLLMKRFGLFLVIAAFLMPSFAFAEAGTPQAVQDFMDILLDAIQGKVIIVVIALILIFSGFMGWKNASATPFIYGIIASLIIGGSVYVGTNLAGVEFNNTKVESNNS